ncbi:MAG: ATP-binding protein [Bacteroidota bacterium]
MTIEDILKLRESEDNVEFKEARTQYQYNKKRRSVLGYTVALANEGGGLLVFGIKESMPLQVVGSQAYVGQMGKLEQDVYRDLKIRIRTHELTEAGTGNRVLVIQVPSRPVGKPLYFADVPLMRVGDRLERMSEEVFLAIVQEQEPDFSAKICSEARLSDLDTGAVATLQQRYAARQSNPLFAQLSPKQALQDLGLIAGEQVTYAALILVGAEATIQQYLPQSKVILEFRHDSNQIEHDWRVEIGEALITGIDRIWDQIHARNSRARLQQGPYVQEMLVFNEQVIREAVLNAVTHRDYSYTSETVIRQTPDQIVINNPGGFPKGVNLENLLTVNSTPRSRLLADVLLKVGLVERSGQGVDKIFAIMLHEGKDAPDYSASDPFQVSLSLNCSLKDPSFHLFLRHLREEVPESPPLGVNSIINLAKVRDGFSRGLDPKVIADLERNGFVERVGSGSSKRYVLGIKYREIVERGNRIGNYVWAEVETVLRVVLRSPDAKMGDFLRSFGEKFTRSQVKYLIDKLVEDGVLTKTGERVNTRYRIAKAFAAQKDQPAEVKQHLHARYGS